MIPISESLPLKVVATETLSKTASTATPGQPLLLLERDPKLFVCLPVVQDPRRPCSWDLRMGSFTFGAE